MGYGQGADLSDIITYPFSPSPLSDGNEYYVEGALCKNGLGRIVFPQGQIECQSGPCVLEFAAYQGLTEVVSWTAIPNINDQE
jgi:hypothetical protein